MPLKYMGVEVQRHPFLASTHKWVVSLTPWPP